jgi:hypothetical protein
MIWRKNMPATFTHCLIARKTIDLIKDKHPYSRKLAAYNQFAMMGAAGPDYPYLTDVASGMLGGHNWANRMHYENTSLIVELGAERLSKMNKDGKDFDICLSWLCGYVSHVIADSFLHPVVNSVVGGIYIFTHADHRNCEMTWDVYIFKKETNDEIRYANPRKGFGYLNILKDCSDTNNPNRLYPSVSGLWTALLKDAHPNAENYFDSLVPDKWHENYMKRVDFIADPKPIFRHVWGIEDFVYKTSIEIEKDKEAYVKYIEKVKLPDKREVHFDVAFDQTLQKVADVWLSLFKGIETASTDNMEEYLKDWNLDTGVNEEKIYYWSQGGS